VSGRELDPLELSAVSPAALIERTNVMRTKWTWAAALAAVVVPVVAVSTARARQENSGMKMPSESEMAEMMKRWTDTFQVGPEHKRLEVFLGKWDTTMRMWMGGPGSPASESKGTSETRWLVEGRWLITESTGEMMGRPVRAIRLLGYDQFKRKYVGCQVDSMTTAMLPFEGNFGGPPAKDGSLNHLLLFGPMDEPMNGEHDKAVRYVHRLVDADHIVSEVHDLMIGEPNTKVVEFELVRKK
jgi:hypothetical protein